MLAPTMMCLYGKRSYAVHPRTPVPFRRTRRPKLCSSCTWMDFLRLNFARMGGSELWAVY